MQRIKSYIALTAAAIIIAAAVLSIPSTNKIKYFIFIDKKLSKDQLVEFLHAKGVVDNTVLINIALFFSEIFTGPPKSGWYDFTKEKTYFSVAFIISNGNNAKITVPEGYSQQEILNLLLKKISSKDSVSIKTVFDVKKNNSEGYLFPATYTLRDYELTKLYIEMKKTFQLKVKSLNPSKTDIILASIIQKEGAKINEYRRIAGVFKNRLKYEMPLESDPILQYIVGRKRLTKEILKTKNKYNSYLYKGLPPGPICNPGMEAIKAAINPEIHDYMYFVAKGDGYHYFSKYKAEHFSAVNYFQLKKRLGWVPAEQKL